MAKYVPFNIQPNKLEQEYKKCISWLADQEIGKLFPILHAVRKDRWAILDVLVHHTIKFFIAAAAHFITDILASGTKVWIKMIFMQISVMAI